MNRESIESMNRWNDYVNGKDVEPMEIAVPCDDAISRQAVLESIFDDDTEYTGSEICSMVRNLPSVTPQPKTGHWIRWYEEKENSYGTEHVPHCKCSECGTEFDPYSSQFVKFCNECGAKMEEVEE